jgi:outer membrane protein OmpA-like peptidoglycan-associated protein
MVFNKSYIFSMSKQVWLFVFFVFICAPLVKAQSEVTPTILNRFIPFKLGNNVNSLYDELNPVITPDENTLFFSRVNHPQNHYGYFRSQDIWYSKKQEDGTWGQAARINAEFNNNRYNALYSVSDNGDCLISGIYTKNGRYRKRGLSIVRYDTAINKWGNPVKVKVPKVSRQDKGLTSSAYMNKKGNIIVLSYTKIWQRANISKVRFSVKNSKGKWKSPKTAKNSIMKNLFKSIETPFLAEDDSTLYYSAYVRGSRSRFQNDIYVSHRLDGSFKRWIDPEPLSSTINSRAWENYYKQFNDDNWAMFTVSSVGNNSDIYMVKLNEPRPYVDLTGIVVLEGNPIKEPFEIMINGQVVDSVRINRDSSSYAVHLPFGYNYEIQAKAAEREAKIERVDATFQLEYSRKEIDLQLSKLPFLDLSGIVTVNGDILTDPFQILINGQVVDSVSTNPSIGLYSVKLPLGRIYELEVKSGNYIPVKDYVDVSAENRQLRVEKNLKLRAIPYVDVEGYLFDKQTNNIIPPQANPKLMINGIAIDTLTLTNGYYKIRIPWGHKYVLQIQADEFDPQPAVIDLTFVKNYKKIMQDLYASPMEKYATITGKVLNKSTNLYITSDFFIDVDGSHSSNSKTHSAIGTYELRLSLGKKSTLTARAEGYFPISETIDLTGEEGNVKVIKDLYLVPLKIGERILLNHIAFETASSNLKPESFADIDRVVDLLRAAPSLKIQIDGYTDSSGKDAYNLSLSDSRAKSVTDYIVSKGIDKGRVQYRGYGEANPVSSNLTSDGRAKNRRVEFVVLEQ